MVVASIPANAGSVLATCYESVRNLQALLWQWSAVCARLEKRLIGVCETVQCMAGERSMDMQTLVYKVAVERIAQAIRLREF